MSNLDKARSILKNLPTPTLSTTNQGQMIGNTVASRTITTINAYDIFKKLGNQIKMERKAQGLTQWELGNKCNLSDQTIRRVENHGWGAPISIATIIFALNKNLTLI